MERDHSGGRSRAPPLPPGPCFLPSYAFLYGFPKMSTMITLIVTHREIQETHGHRPAVEQGGLWEARLWRGGWAHQHTSGPHPESRRTGASHLLQLQLALPLPHDVALFQQLLLGLLKLFLPLEARHKDWAEPGASVGLGELRASQAATRWHCRPSPGSHCRHQAHSRDSFGTASGRRQLPRPLSPTASPGKGWAHSRWPGHPLCSSSHNGITFKPFPLAYRACSPIPDHWALAPADSQPGMLLTGALGWHPGLCTQRHPTSPSAGFIPFPMPGTIFVFAYTSKSLCPHRRKLLLPWSREQPSPCR